MPGGDFSLRSYIQGDDRRWLFVPFQESEFGISRALIATWMDILVSAGLERPEGGQQTWIIIDELDTLGQLSSLIAATTKLRKRKVAVVTAFQSVSQLEEHYGPNGATTLLNCLSNKVVLRCTDATTADRMSKELGEREVWKESFSNTNVGGPSSPGNQAKSQHVERVVMPSQLQGLKDLHGYIKLSGDFPVTSCLASIDAGKPAQQAA
jgi:type IV secretory pathway TraG/TraD family ATPase VirD4